jgi:hypothetical protein
MSFRLTDRPLRGCHSINLLHTLFEGGMKNEEARDLPARFLAVRSAPFHEKMETSEDPALVCQHSIDQKNVDCSKNDHNQI